jgi:uncharacterized NAD(P)/FAD-binding protein YdhS
MLARRPHPRTIGITGAGFTGTLLALHLLRRCGEGDRILLIEKRPRFGAGLAYATGNPHHLLNVRAGNMSAFSAEPDHFVQWLRKLPPETRTMIDGDPPDGMPGPTSFAPRGLYGTYIQQCLADALWHDYRGERLTIVNDEAMALTRGENGVAIQLAVGRSLTVDAAIVAIGNLIPVRDSAPRVFRDPWDERATAALDPAADVIILGTGLTMVDTVITLLGHGHQGKIHAVSRRGLLPRAHVAAIPDESGAIRLPPAWGFDPPPSGRSLVSLMQEVRRTIDRAERAGRGWRSVIDGLRPHTQRLWRELSPGDRARFLRHLRAWWDVHRHRGAPQVMARIGAARERGQLRVVSGHVLNIASDKDAGVDATIRLRRSDETLILSGQRLIDCTGLGADCTRVDQPLLRQLLATGLARPDALKLGLDVTEDGALIDGNGHAAPDLYAIGPITKGALWEITAVPDLRLACEQMAARLTMPLAVARRASG